MANINIKEKLTDSQFKDYTFVVNRIQELQKTRQDILGQNIEKIWEEADKAYIPHRLKAKGRKIISIDEEKGMRGSMIEIGKTGDWQADFSKPNAFIKMQTALSILIDRNPEAVLMAGSSRYEQNTLLIKNLYQRSWEIARSKQQLKLFCLNLMKYGWGIGRTYPKLIRRNVKQLVKYDQENPDKSEYEEKEVIEYNDIFRKSLDPYNCWIDDMSRPNEPDSLRDWAWREVYSLDALKEEFGQYKRFKELFDEDDNFTGGQGIITQRLNQTTGIKKFQETKLCEVYFYESKAKDLFMVILGGYDGIPIVIEPLPISDSEGRKKLSCWQTYWLLRHSEIPYGVGMYEAMRDDQRVLDRVRNMTIDQLVLSIYKMFLYQGTQTLTETGKIVIEPGAGKQVLDPKNVNWMNIPGPGIEAWRGLEVFSKDVNDSAGVSEILEGQVTGKTAFEVAQAKEAALKRLKLPLDNIAEALEEEAYISISLIQTLYSIPEVYKIADEEKINKYLKEIKGDQDLYERNERDEFTAKVFREVQIGLDKDEKGNLIETEDTRFFRIKPSGLNWAGVIKIKGQSVLVISKELEKAQDLEFVSVLNPLIHDDPAITGKLAKQITKIYDKDPEDWLPAQFLQQMEGQAAQPLLIPPQQGLAPQSAGVGQMPSAPSLRGTPPNVIQRFMSTLRRASPFAGGAAR